MLEIARSELIQIFRNRLVMVSALVIPVAVGAYLVYQHETFADLASLGYLTRLLPGGAATEPVVNAWNGGVPLAESPLLASTVAWVLVAVSLAGRLFRWEPRR